MNDKILVADDEKSIAKAIAYAMKREGYTVEIAYDGEEALRKINLIRPDIAILDVMMPKLNGFEICKKLEHREGLGIILLTAKNDVVDKVLGLELGADDYITKPFDMRELEARVKSLLRRLLPQEKRQDIQLGGLLLQLKQHRVMIDGQFLDLTPKEFDILALLLTHLERVYSREELLDIIWGMEYVGGTRTVDIHMQRLRKKLGEPYQELLQTVYGVGYKAVGELT